MYAAVLTSGPDTALSKPAFPQRSVAWLVGCILMLLAMVLPGAAEARYASIIVNETSGKVLFARNADKQLFPASLTKVMTLYLLFEALDSGVLTMDTRMKVSKVAAGRSPSKLGLRNGNTLKVSDAIYALVTKSANDAATVIAEHLGGTERAFARRMTRKARALGMANTTFRNASGLPHSKQKSTARDMAKLAIAIRQDFPHHFGVFKTKHFSWKGRRFKNHNTLLRRYDGTDGIKTGYIRASGFNLIASVERNGTRLVGVVFGGRTGASRDDHMMQLLDKQFARLPRIKGPLVTPVAKPQQQPSAGPNPQSRTRGDTLASVLGPVTPPPTRPQLPSPILPDLDEQAAVSEPASSWGIQIGSFARRSNAHRAARDARQAATAILSQQPARLMEVRFGAVTLWQVRFFGFDEDAARQACIALFRQNLSCIAVPDPKTG